MICSAIIIINLLNVPLNRTDKIVMKHAQTVCEQRYPEAPCLKIFKKLGPNNYQVTCGKKEKK